MSTIVLRHLPLLHVMPGELASGLQALRRIMSVTTTSIKVTRLMRRFDYEIVEGLSFELLGIYSEASKGVPGSINSTVSDYNDSETDNWLLSPGLKYESGCS